MKSRIAFSIGVILGLLDPLLASEIVEIPFGRFEQPKISDNGYVVGSNSYGSIWSESGGKVATELTSIRALSNNGLIAVGEVIQRGDDRLLVDKHAGIWNSDSGLFEIPHLDGTHKATPYSVSGDGRVVVGWNEEVCSDGSIGCPRVYGAFVWSEDQGTNRIETPNGFTEDMYPFVTNDGEHIVAMGKREGDNYYQRLLRGTVENASLQEIAAFESHGHLNPSDISGDGTAIVGRAGVGGDVNAFYWSEDGGLTFLGWMPEHKRSDANGVSADGEVVIGTSGDAGGSGSTAIVWDAKDGLRELRQLLVDEYNITLPDDVYFDTGDSISKDRKRIVTSYLTAFGGGSHLIKLDWPIGPPTDDGDMNFDDTVDATDVDLQMEAIRQYPKATFHDLDFSGRVDADDLTHLIKTALNTWFGDANLDGEFNSSDLVTVFRAGQYEDDIDDNSGWASGDWNADGDFTTGDLTAAFQDGGYDQGPRPALIAVPEPSAGFLALMACLLGVVSRSLPRRSRS